jgi:cytochrome bd-type quinol oxidase subunit 1
MDLTALLLSRLQFAFTVSFHIIFPSFMIGLAAWLTVLEALHLGTDRPAYRLAFEFWLKIFGVAFGLGVVSGIVMARMCGPIRGPLLSYETFTAFFLEVSFFGILLFGRPRVPPWFYLFSTAMVALGATLSALWIMANNSWMQGPLAEDLGAMRRWLERPYLFIIPVIGGIAAFVAAKSVGNRRDGVPFYLVGLIFAAASGTLAISFWPYMIPFSITIGEAAAPHSSLTFMFWGEGIFVFPLMLVYTVISYSVFRGKAPPTTSHG